MKSKYAMALVASLCVVSACKTGSSPQPNEPSSEPAEVKEEDAGQDPTRVDPDEDLSYELRLEVTAEGVFRGETMLVNIEDWTLQTSETERLDIPSIEEELANSLGAGAGSTSGGGSASDNSETSQLLIEMHPLTRYDVWSRIFITAARTASPQVYSGLVGEGFENFGATEVRRYETPGKRSGEAGLEVDELLGQEKSAEQSGSSEEEKGASGEVDGAFETPETESMAITIEIAEEGIRVGTTEGLVSPVEDCPENGPTICPTISASDLRELVGEARSAVSEGDHETARKRATDVRNAFDFRRLYEIVTRLDEEHPRLNRLRITAEPETPVFLVTEIADHLKVLLPERSYGERSVYQVARAQAEDRYEALFPTVVLGAPLGSTADPEN